MPLPELHPAEILLKRDLGLGIEAFQRDLGEFGAPNAVILRDPKWELSFASDAGWWWSADDYHSSNSLPVTADK